MGEEPPANIVPNSGQSEFRSLVLFRTMAGSKRTCRGNETRAGTHSAKTHSAKTHMGDSAQCENAQCGSAQCGNAHDKMAVCGNAHPVGGV